MCPSLGAVARCRPNLAPMALETSPQSPAPVRQIANAISGWVDRLGAVWVEGQIAQVSRRPGLATVFMTLRDTVADISIPVTCSRRPLRQPQPSAGRGRQRRDARQAVVLRQPRHPLPPRPRDPDGRPRRAAGPARAPPPAAGRRGPLRRRAQATPAVPAGSRRAGHRAQLRRRARRPRERPSPLAGGRLRGGVRRDAGPAVRRRGDRGARAARSRPERRGDRHRPRRRVGRGPPPVLRRGAGPSRAPRPHPRRLRHRPRAGHPPARPRRRRPRLHAHRRRQARRPRRPRRAAPGAHGP